MSNPLEYPFAEGIVVVAIKTITEGGEGYPGDDKAKDLWDKNWIHARVGDVGKVIGVHDPDEDYPDGKPTVRFLNSGTASLVFDHEIIFGAPSMKIWEMLNDLMARKLLTPREGEQ